MHRFSHKILKPINITPLQDSISPLHQMALEDMQIDTDFDDGINLPLDATQFIDPDKEDDIEEDDDESVELLVIGLDPSLSTTTLQQVNNLLDETRKEKEGFIPRNIAAMKASNWETDHVKVRGRSVSEMAQTMLYLRGKGLDVCWSPGMGQDKTRTVSASLRNLWTSEASNPKLEKEFEKAFQKVAGPEVKILNFYVSTVGIDPKAFIDINLRAAIPKLTQNKITIRKTNVTIYPPSVIIPTHPYQLAVNAQQLPSKAKLDSYTKRTYGLRSSELINNSLYLFVVSGGWKQIDHAMKIWHPVRFGTSSIPPPQLLYHYNTTRRTRKTVDEVKAANAS